eukprot:PhF_6_TR25832/c0_g1_i2/m.36488
MLFHGVTIHNFLWFVAFTVCFLQNIVAVPYSQDGYGASGTITYFRHTYENLTMVKYSNWPSGFTKTGSKFEGAVFDGTCIWMVPLTANRVVRLNTSTGEMTGFNNWPSGFVLPARVFSGGVYDGTSVWLIPHNDDHVMQIRISDGRMTAYEL